MSRGNRMKESTPKQKLFETAARLFYAHGYRATGVDAIAAEAGIGKMTLYRHYPSKDELIVAFLRQSNAEFWAYFERSTAGAPDARQKLLAFFASLQDYVLSPTCYGCSFLNIATEYPARDYVGHQVALEHKQAVRQHFAQLAQEAGAQQPQALADALFLLMDGAYMAARVFGSTPENPASAVTEAATRLIEGYCGA